jgi:hypothetical protein
MTNRESILLCDPTASLIKEDDIWRARGNGWATCMCGTEDDAWFMATFALKNYFRILEIEEHIGKYPWSCDSL